MPFVYILECADNRYYIGSTINIDRRLKEHSNKKCLFTKSRLPVKLIYTEKYEILSLTRKRELQIKNHKSRKYIEKLVKSTL